LFTVTKQWKPVETKQSNETAMSTSESKVITRECNIEPHHWGGQRPSKILQIWRETSRHDRERKDTYIFYIEWVKIFSSTQTFSSFFIDPPKNKEHIEFNILEIFW